MMPTFPAHFGKLFPGAEHLHHDIYPAINAATNSSLAQPGKVVLLTGAGRGIGRAIAVQYALANVASIAISARTQSQLDETEQEINKANQNVRVRKLRLDVVDCDAVKRAANSLREDEGRLDVLVNNAGYSCDWVSIAKADPHDWWKTFEVNVKGPFNFLHAFLPLLMDTAKTHETTVDVINMTSIGAHSTYPGQSAYGSTKLALLRMTEFVHAEYGRRGINAVALHPGGVDTELTKGLRVLEGLLGETPELSAGFVVWLTKGHKTWLAGRYVDASWDVDRLEEMKEEIVAGDELVVRMVVEPKL